MKDWLIRALKTFVQAFFGVLIPAVCTMLSGGWPESWNAVWVILAPTVAAALSAAICAVWNIILEKLQEDQKKPVATVEGELITDPTKAPAAPGPDYREQVDDYLAKH